MPIPRNEARRASRSLLRDDVYITLRDAIVRGTFLPGEQLRDVELGEWLGVSRTPVREALLRLERSSLVIARPGRSTVVAPLDLRATLDASSVAAELHGLAARLAAPRLTGDELDRMGACNRGFAAALDAGDPTAALAADTDFHDVAVAASGNGMLRESLEQATPLLRRVEMIRFGSLAGRASVEQHDRILAAFATGDADAAAAAARENWLTLEQHLLGLSVQQL
ncbi:GntR family transcriptional regulator [Planctomonas psychrotolerans]|uniref:GntR family transcriptional regulator n=1 Tax=Planctomonas psychrotolerans TaxID=2528712 RepID=UPI00123A2572|nr:GntR family transcriptional regulator [Planctomonas psychrotolerans]